MTKPPTIACSLTEDQVGARTDLAAEIGRAGLLDVSTDGSRASLVFACTDVSRSDIDDFVEAESECCPFFDFEVNPRGDNLELKIEAPEDGVPLTRGLVASFTDGWRIS